MNICKFEGCGKKAICHGFCAGHNRQYKSGETLRPLQVQYHGLPESIRFLKRVDKRGRDECWNWQGSRKANWHGQWRNASGEIELAHRASWRLFVGYIPDGLSILHRCDNPICTNPAHLFLGTQTDNMMDMWAKKRGRPGVSIGQKHGMSKLTAEQVTDIRYSGLTGSELAKKHNITQTTVCDIRKRRSWNHIP